MGTFWSGFLFDFTGFGHLKMTKDFEMFMVSNRTNQVYCSQIQSGESDWSFPIVYAQNQKKHQTAC